MKKSLYLWATLMTCYTLSNAQINEDLVSAQSAITVSKVAFIPTNKKQFYFPLDQFRDTSIYAGHETFVNVWYSQHLFAMREPVIFADKSSSEIYRFTWLRTFHHPVAIRIEKQGETYMLYWKLNDGHGGYKPGKLAVNAHKSINKAKWNLFKGKLKGIDFWNMKTNEKMFGNDGSQWILEGKEGKLYHVVDRWTPNNKRAYYQCCDFLIGLTNLEFTGDEKY